MKVETWLNIGIIYLAILFGTAIASLIPYDLEGWLMLSAFLMIVWLIEIGLIEKEVKGNENIN